MIIELPPEDEKLVQKQLESGAFSTVDEIIHRALESLDADELWLRENKDVINAKIQRGLAQLDRGEAISGEDSRTWLQEKKAAWLKQQESY